MVDPVTRLSVSALLANLDRRPSYLAFAMNDGARRRPLFARLSAGLGAAGLSDGDGDWMRRFSDSISRSPPLTIDDRRAAMMAEAAHVKSRAIAARAEDLRADRWSEELWGDRWLVTDFWFDTFLGPFWMGRSTDEFFEARPRVVPPTIVALIRPFDKDVDFCLVKEHPNLDFGGWPIGGAGVPIFVPEGRDADSIAEELLVICRASRP